MAVRTVRFGLVLSEREREALTWLAQIEGGLSEADVLRRLLRREAKERGFLPPADHAPACAGHIQEVNNGEHTK